jgi:hypothetical protein
LQDTGIIQLADAVLGVLVEQQSEDLAGCRLVGLEEGGVLLADSPDPIGSGGKRLVPRQVDQRVNGVVTIQVVLAEGPPPVRMGV